MGSRATTAVFFFCFCGGNAHCFGGEIANAPVEDAGSFFSFHGKYDQEDRESPELFFFFCDQRLTGTADEGTTHPSRNMCRRHNSWTLRRCAIVSDALRICASCFLWSPRGSFETFFFAGRRWQQVTFVLARSSRSRTILAARRVSRVARSRSGLQIILSVDKTGYP